METGVAITTFDNPFNPFTQFEQWFLFDVDYNTCGYLGRIARTSDSLSDEENDEDVISAKTESLQTAKHVEELYEKAMAAMTSYRGERDDIDED